MNWNNKNWEEEDKLFYPKRKVDNKIGWYRPHIIGSFHSNKMEKIIEYHSLNKKYWNHVPDVLVFRENSAPLLYQIKESP
ncbi:hypothetical protein C4A75_14665 [Brevibacillus laterosporus]|uniref:hypothetical protein n=1 Tax=Brevibacillus laterosporus TaxID=1465 RepID=UPI000CE31960|nr:hypothetical protein [Brevibacillus laterosporus]PPA83585.1 hypothetical protein C4A75_14665 [Brevibacillus laterosporus]